MSQIEDDFDEQALYSPPPIQPARPAPISMPPVQIPRAATPPNPLSSYFRMPGLHVPLPTRGAFLPEGSIDLTIAGDLPIFPMKASDEHLMRQPDALMSGYALEKLVESCVPAIKTPRLISTPDLDVILLAIRAATYGDNMTIEVECPKCNAENTFECHLPSIMSNISFIEPINEVRLADEIVVQIRPFNMEAATKVALARFNESRALQATEENTPERIDALNKGYERLTQLNLDCVADSIIQVVVPTGPVTDKANIREFISNTSQGWVKKIENALGDLNNKGIDKHVDVKCTKCEHEWRAEVEFDPTSFFDLGS